MGNLQAAGALRKISQKLVTAFVFWSVCVLRGGCSGPHAPPLHATLYKSAAGNCVAGSPKRQHPWSCPFHSSLLQHSKSGQLFAHVTLTRAGSRDRTFWNNDGRKLGGLNAPRVPVICTSLDNWGQGGRSAEVRGPGLRLEEQDGGELT